MEKYNVTGMSCAACSARVEKAVKQVNGVKECAVNLLTNSMVVEGTADEKSIVAAVLNAGYGAQKVGSKNESDSVLNGEHEISLVRKRFIVSAALLLVLMYFSMGNMIFGLEYSGVFNENPLATGIVQMLLSGIIMVINQKFFVSGYKSTIHRAPNMDVLVSIGSIAAFIYSVYALFEMSTAYVNGDMALAHSYMHELYFESAAMILTLITLGKLLEAYSKGKTTNAIKKLMDLTPKTAIVVRDGKEVLVDASDIQIGDIFIVKPGMSIVADGIVVEGSSAVNESALTGESMPVDKNTGDKVSAATVNMSGFLKCEATDVGEDTAISKIIKMVSDAASTKAPIAKIADKISGVFVPVIIAVAVITIVVWMILGESFGFSLARGISVLVISCPCAFGLATPVAIMVGSGVGAKHGILYKTSEILENAGRVKYVVLDKTGTITKGEPFVTDILVCDGVATEELLETAYSLEKNSEHPLAKAIVKKCGEDNIPLVSIEDFSQIGGSGVTGRIGTDKVYGGNIKFLSQITDIAPEMKETLTALSSLGKTPVIFAKGDKLLGIIAVSDVIKNDSPAAVEELKSMGIEVVMLTGDNSNTANAVAKEVNIEKVVSDVYPDGKENEIRKLQEKGIVAMVGDGINDAPALTRADVGIAIGAGVDIAVDSADIVLTGKSLHAVADAIKIGRKTLRNIHQNLFWAFSYNIIGIPLAAGVWINITGWKLNPMFAAAAMSISSVLVITNALRLNLFKTNIKEKKMKNMETTLKIEGMMCPHCEGRVKKALEETNGVISAEVSHKANNAVIKHNADVTEDVLKSVVENAGYKVI